MLPCPFCGSEPEVRTDGFGTVSLGCANNSCPVDAVYVALYSSHDAYEAWNCRAATAPAQGTTHPQHLTVSRRDGRACLLADDGEVVADLTHYADAVWIADCVDRCLTAPAQGEGVREAADELLRQITANLFAGAGHDHWDWTQQHGAGCETCAEGSIGRDRIRTAASALLAALAAADEGPPGFVDAHLPDECVTELMNEIARLNDQIAQLKAAADEGRWCGCGCECDPLCLCPCHSLRGGGK